MSKPGNEVTHLDKLSVADKNAIKMYEGMFLKMDGMVYKVVKAKDTCWTCCFSSEMDLCNMAPNCGSDHGNFQYRRVHDINREDT